MTDHSLHLLSDPVLWESFSKMGLSVVEDQFSAAEVVPRYEEFYAEVLGSK